MVDPPREPGLGWGDPGRFRSAIGKDFMSSPVPVVRRKAVLGESPLWSPAEGALYWVDVQNPTIFRLDPRTGEVRHWRVETEIGAIGLAGPGRLIAGLRTGIAYFDLETGALEPVADPEGRHRFNENRMNDGKVDRAGRFWCGTMQDPGHAPVGTLWRVTADGAAAAVRTGIRIPNATCWSPDDRRMYFTDSLSKQIWAFDYDLDSGEMSDMRVFAELGPGEGVADGATVDSEGFLWCARMFGGKVVRYDPDGRIARSVALPVPQVTCCAFGGADLGTLYITTASIDMDRAALAERPLAGALFALDAGVRGLPEPRFGG